jgi:hypothetical protein
MHEAIVRRLPPDSPTPPPPWSRTAQAAAVDHRSEGPLAPRTGPEPRLAAACRQPPRGSGYRQQLKASVRRQQANGGGLDMCQEVIYTREGLIQTPGGDSGMAWPGPA